MGFKIAQKTFEVIPTGDYPATIEAIELTDGQFGQQLKFSFSLDGKNQTLWGWASASFTPKSKLYSWTRAAMGGRPIPLNYNLDTDHLIGKQVLLTVVISRKEDGAEFNKISDVRPYLNGNGPLPAGQVVASYGDERVTATLYATGKAEAGPAPIYMEGDSF